MSEAIVMPDLLTPVEPDTQPEFPCPHCERVFYTSNQLGGHLSGAHTTRATKEPIKVPCPECGAEYQRGVGLASHRSRVHGVPGTSKSARMRAKTPPKPKESKAKQKVAEIEKVEPHEWDVDDIFEVVVSTMWPQGTVPVSAVIPLIHWREATRQLLESVTQQNTQT
jgi:predicted RNA-binding Zn-ribbon protein involved in translation (DUF1610 family)